MENTPFRSGDNIEEPELPFLFKDAAGNPPGNRHFEPLFANEKAAGENEIHCPECEDSDPNCTRCYGKWFKGH